MTIYTTPTATDIDDRDDVRRLLANLKASLSQLEHLLEECGSHWGYEDPVYRFYHQSYKVFGLQAETTKIVRALHALLPERDLNEWFMQIVRDGTGTQFENGHNRRWSEATRPILEAFFHAKFFLEMAVRYGRQLETPPRLLPSGWAALLYLYD